MNLSKKEEAEVMRVYDTWLTTYLNGDIKTYDSFLDDDYRFIGSTNNEEFLNRKDTTNFLKITADQFAGKTELRNTFRTIKHIDGLILITHLFDAYFLSGNDWAYYGRFRFTSALRKKENKWKFIYQHFSMPDSKAQEGETIGYEKVAAENLQLKDAIKRRTIELEYKNRELEIEAATERVRVQSMAMQHPNDLETVNKELLHQLTKLKIDGLSGVSFYFVDEDEIVTVWDLSSPGSMSDPNSYSFKYDSKKFPFLGEFVGILKSTQDEYFVLDFPKEKLLVGIEELKEINITIYKALKNAVESGALLHQWNPVARITDGILSIDLMKPPTDDTKTILLKMAGAFNQAYTRFLDLQKAEAQAREAHIETALEKVRSRTMGMQKSEELTEVAGLLFKQVTDLGINSWTAGFNVWSDDNNSYVDYITSPNGGFIEPYIVLTERAEALQDISNARKSGVEFDVQYVEGEKIKQLYIALTGLGEEQFEKMRQDGNQFPSHQYEHFVFGSRVSLMFITYEPVPEAHDIFKRFGKVFEQTYTRFLDLQKAEAQAKEAQIETALERVRSRSLAMHKSDELNEVVSVVFERLKDLHIPFTAVGIAISIEGSKDLNAFVCGENEAGLVITNYRLPYFDNKISNDFNKVLENRLDYFVGQYSKEEKDAFYTYVLEHTPEFRQLPENIKRIIFDSASYTVSMMAVNKAIFNINDFEGKVLADDEVDIIKRFAKVFDQAYTRFLDLQKAEAQAREAHIEASLERVRASAMAMHHSTELTHVLSVLFDQFDILGICPVYSQMSLLNLDTNTFEFRCTGKLGRRVMAQQTLAIDSIDIVKETVEKWKNSEPKSIHELYFPNEVIPGLFKLFKEIRSATPADALPNIEDFPDGLYVTEGNFQFGYMGFAHSRKATAEEKDIVLKFATEFGRLYQRFLDLQKAEEQTREAQIETALERVRSRTMGMQKSDELAEAATLVFKQFDSLGLLPEGSRIFFSLIDEGTATSEVWTTKEDGILRPGSHRISLTSIKHLKDVYEYWKEKKSIYNSELTGSVLTDYLKYLASVPYLNEDKTIQQILISPPDCLVFTEAFFTQGTIGVVGVIPLSQESQNILMRFSKVFEQTYTRFLDLQKAEAQAREAQIELALERVRARTMAMQHSVELQDTSLLLFEQLKELGEPAEQCTIGIIKESEGVVEISATLHGNKMRQTFRHKLDEPFVMTKMFKSWKEQQKTLVLEIKEEELQQYNQYRNELVGKETFPVKLLPGDRWIIHVAYFSKGMLALSTNEPRPAESLQLLERFAIVFEQTYTRFLDLQKAEAQAKEAQIEAALERTRTQSMIMQHSNELDDTLRVFHQQVLLLGIQSAFSFLWLPDEEKDQHKFWAVWAENNSIDFSSKAINYPLDRNEPATAQCLLDWKSKDPVFSYHVPPEGVENYFRVWHELIDGVELLKPEYFSGGLYYVEAFIKYGCFGVMVETDLTEAEKKLLGRFAVEFERTYTRFLDLQKAEAQAREGQIELALERVRSRTMAMHKTDELLDAAELVSKELSFLGIESLNVSYAFVDDDEKYGSYYSLNPVDGKIPPFPFVFPHTKTEVMRSILSSWKKQQPFNVIELNEKATLKHQRYIGDHIQQKLAKNSIPFSVEDFLAISPKRAVLSTFNFTKGYLFNIGGERLSKVQEELMLRFTRVFEQTYTRFLDLQKAEAQAKEAQIETALERVRARTMGMQKSEELKDVIKIVYQQITLLQINCNHAGFVVDYTPKGDWHFWIADEQDIPGKITHPYFNSVWATQFDEAKEKCANLFATNLNFEEKNKFYHELLSHVPGLPQASKDYYLNCPGLSASTVLLDDVGLYIENFSAIPYTEEENNILIRFGKVFQQTYTRFLDLQKAEAQAKEAQIEAALERVRSRTLAMHKSDELAETAAEVFRQLIGLGIEPNRLYIGIVKEEKGDMEMWATDEDGTQVGKEFMFNKDENASVKKLYDGWATKQKSVIVDMQGKELEDYLHYLNNVMHIPFKGGLTQKRRVQSVAYFSKGFIGMASPDGQGDETIKLLERFAAVFNLTFTRFNDLKIAEAHAIQAEEDLVKLQAEKNRAEDALAELQVTQKQLIQSEKMASLGELTAGIAHEIQNPLNFVNNFSEVSTELLDEMNAEIAKGDFEEAKLIANDIKQNLEKINHHGKRADAIVKGMLQHSRSSSAVKEPTDINKLADEYLRLAYHGLRAKDKSFNATMKTDYDETIENINIIPQDMGRVILNLITNAFYAVNEKKKLGIEGYEPIVSISTKKINDKVEIKVTDNGNGIPQNIIDKIFQPFFTTKPTGQGTGLGLSLAYDIVKAHGGELNVETNEGEGTTFSFYLFVTNDL